MRNPWCALGWCCLVTSFACSSAGAPSVAPAPLGAEAQAVIAAVEGMFTAMREHDVEGLRALVAPGAIIVRVGQDKSGASVHQVISDDDFIAGTAGEPAVIDEQFVGVPRVEIDGAVASLWGRYDARVDGEFMHCGVDAVQLAKLAGGWQVTAVTYNARKEG